MDYTVQQQTDAVMWWNNLPRQEQPLLIELHFSVWDIPWGTAFYLSIDQICEIYEKEVINKVKSRVVITASYLDAFLGDIEQYKSVVILSCYDWASRVDSMCPPLPFFPTFKMVKRSCYDWKSREN